MSEIVNSSAKNSYFDINGSAITSSTQPNVNVGSAAGIGTTEIERDIMTGYEPAFVNATTLVYSGTNKIAGVGHSMSNENTNLPDNQRQTLKTVLTATAIRNDQWVAYSGIFFPAVSTSDDTSATSLLSDNAAKAGSRTRVTYNIGVSNTNKQLTD